MFDRTDYCGNINEKYLNKEVVVCGWVQRQRDLGQLIFVDLRDRSGIVQLAFDNFTDKEIFEKAFKLRAEFVLCAKGIVRERSSKNLNIPTGCIEIHVNYLEVLAESETPPFEIVENSNAGEELKFKYRYLDLRRKDVQEKIILRSKIVKVIRDYFYEEDFVEIETPVLIKSTPEGARDYLVPSRIFPGSFFALPQSPQLYKQLVMIAGFDKYVQIAKCFRDEDLRADRQPEFTQVDFEMSFINEEKIMKVAENLIINIYKKVFNIEIKKNFLKLNYEECMNKYGSDKPDLRFDLKIVNLNNIFKNTSFKVFKESLDFNGNVCGINVKNCAEKFSRKEIDKLASWLKFYGAKGLAWMKNLNSSFEKFLNQEEIVKVKKIFNFEENDIIFIISDKNKKTVLESLGALRLELGKRLNLIDNKKVSLLWVTDFPLFEFNKEENRFVAEHHPFTAPKEEDLIFLEKNPEKVRARAYDLVMNGNEIGGGSIRICDYKLQEEIFKILNFSENYIKESFGFLINAFKYGAPPHGGLAFGLDRLIAVLLNCENIREVIAFPKVSSSAELMTDCPNCAEKKQLDELRIKIF